MWHLGLSGALGHLRGFPHVCWGRSCCFQSSVKSTVMRCLWTVKGSLAPHCSSMFFSLPFHFNWFSKHRSAWNWNIRVSEELDTQFFLLPPGEGRRKSLLSENCWRRGDYDAYLCRVSIHSEFCQTNLNENGVTFFPAFLADVKCPLHCWFLLPL